ncbi:sortase [Nocardioides marmorisolisilvae]|uniref:Sortase n=1 Tax=Nocardioides marmorisolisilvae TaxID=1542737 RepID=A0A3N0DRZ5_9ACTN|nr:sortase [Nocardioides marmorisolisilvae]
MPLGYAALSAWMLTTVGLVLLAFVGFLLLGSSVQANRAQDVAYSKIREQLADGIAPVSGVVAAGTPIGVLEIPALDLHQALLQGSTSEQTVDGPGLKSDTAFPGATGNSLIVGRRATFGAPFRHLARLKVGDEITVVTGLGKAVFTVDVVRHSDDPTSTVPAAASRITLVTSDPALTPTRQIVVSAALVGTPYPAATTPVARDGEAPGQRTWDRAIFVLLWTQLLLVVAWATTRLALRFGHRAVWIGAVPVVLFVLWNLFEGVAVLLPNTL